MDTDQVEDRRRTKIVCTLGPAVASADGVASLVLAGMDVARLNYSHGSHDEHSRAAEWVRAAADTAGRAVCLLADLPGPKVRLGTFRDGSANWQRGDRVTITDEPVDGTASRVSTTFPGLSRVVRPGDRLLLDDGKVALQVVSVGSSEVVATVEEGGRVSDHKGIALPGVDLGLPALTPRDVEHLRAAVEIAVDAVALSFVRAPEDVDQVRAVLAAAGASGVLVIAKIERPEAVRRLTQIIDAFDGVMVARGDLGVELPLEQVPLVQRRAIALARTHAKPVIVATQMLESMINESRPTRAEVSDVANAVFDGADALMLSAETSVGAHPEPAVRTMARIAQVAEQSPDTVAVTGDSAGTSMVPSDGASSALAAAAAEVTRDVGARALVTFTETGATARRIARHRPERPIFAFTPQPLVRRQLALSWGVEAYVTPAVQTIDEMLQQVDDGLRSHGHAQDDDVIVVVAGTPGATAGGTNQLHVHRVRASRADAADTRPRVDHERWPSPDTDGDHTHGR
jgi:pyruvate kinase